VHAQGRSCTDPPFDLHGPKSKTEVIVVFMWEMRVRKGVRFLLAACGATAVWAFVVNRVVIQWVDGPFKVTTIVLLGLGLAALGAVSARMASSETRRLSAWAWPAVLGAFGIGEAHRAWLRSEYGAHSSESSPWDPITTEDLVVRRFTLDVPALGATPLRVVALSDLHVTDDTSETYVRRVHDAIRSLGPDVLLFTGDYISKPSRLPALERWLDGLPSPRHGSYAVLGNHDHWTGRADDVRTAFGRAGVSVLAGTCASVAVTEAPPLRVCGTEEPWGPALSRPLSNDGVAATLVLSHTPDNVYALAEQGATAVFAGHTHGGQFRIPFLGPLLMPSRYGRRFDQGHFEVEGTHLYVSAGVGADAPNLRLWCPPDLVVVDLVGQTR
jgi:predicted MPP superfamily phosphohydrolase